jgi:stage III sporulation protein AG
MSAFKDFINKITAKPGAKKMIIIGLFGIMLMIGASTLLETEEPVKNPDVRDEGSNDGSKGGEADSSYKDKKALEKDIEELLARIENAGKVKVLITYDNGGELVTEKDITQKESTTTEEDGDGGKRNVTDRDTSSEVVYEDSQNSKAPFVKSELYPKIRGVVVIAEGGNDEIVVSKITRSLEVLLDLPVHKIQVTR